MVEEKEASLTSRGYSVDPFMTYAESKKKTTVPKQPGKAGILWVDAMCEKQ